MRRLNRAQRLGALAARYRSVLLVTVGTTLGMAAADGLAVFLGEAGLPNCEMISAIVLPSFFRR